MKYLIATLLTILCCLPVQACNYGGGYGAGFSLGYSYAPQAQFYVQPPVQTIIQYAAPAPVVTTQVQYSYAAPLSTVIQYAAPLYAPVQPYYTNFNLGYGNFNRGFNVNYNRGFAFNNGHNHNNFNRGFSFNNGRGFSVNIRR